MCLMEVFTRGGIQRYQKLDQDLRGVMVQLLYLGQAVVCLCVVGQSETQNNLILNESDLFLQRKVLVFCQLRLKMLFLLVLNQLLTV